LNDNNPTAARTTDTTPADAKDDFLTRWGANDIGAKIDREAATARTDEVPPPPPRPDADDSRAPDKPQPPHANDNDAPADRAAASATVTKEQEKEQETPILRPDPNLPTRDRDPDDAAFQLEPHDKTDPSAVAQAKGIVAYRKGDLTLALAELSRAVALNPAFMLAYVNRGIVLYRMGKLDLALADVARARRIDRAGQRRTAASLSKRRRGVSSLIEGSTLMLATGQ
jgi:tetratricopeptide (TPR) repeat protein